MICLLCLTFYIIYYINIQYGSNFREKALGNYPDHTMQANRIILKCDQDIISRCSH